MNPFENKEQLAGIMLPYPRLTELNLKKALSLFDSLSMLQPWHMESPSFLSQAAQYALVRVVNPPESLKPVDDIRALLSDYRNWLMLHKDRSLRVSLMASLGKDGDAMWDIRKMVRHGMAQTVISEESLSLKWHLLLHLAQAVEEEGEGASQMLRGLKERNSPLKNAVEEEEGIEFLHDLPESISELPMEEHLLRQVLDAWLSLFGEYLRGKELLITLSGQVMDCVYEIWQESKKGDLRALEPPIVIEVPDLSQYGLEELLEVKREIFLEPSYSRLKKSTLDYCHDPDSEISLAELRMATESVPVSSPVVRTERLMKFSLRHLGHASNDRSRKGLWRHFSGKTIVLMEDKLSYG